MALKNKHFLVISSGIIVILIAIAFFLKRNYDDDSVYNITN